MMSTDAKAMRQVGYAASDAMLSATEAMERFNLAWKQQQRRERVAQKRRRRERSSDA